MIVHIEQSKYLAKKIKMEVYKQQHNVINALHKRLADM